MPSFAKAVVVLDPSGNPLPNCIGELNGVKSPLTNSDGYALFNISFPSIPTSLIVYANGYKTYLQPVNLGNANQNLIVGGNSSSPNDINLPPLSFSKPSRERILNVKANLCNILDAQSLPIFESFASTLFFEDRNRLNDWISRLKDNGSTHITTELSGDYDTYLDWLGGRYPIVGLDFMNNIDGFRRWLDYLFSVDLIPIIKSGCDGQGYSPSGKTYGCQWGLDNLPRIYNQLSSYKDMCLWSTSWVGGFPDWSPKQTIDFIHMMRSSLGENACLDAEFGASSTESISYCHMGNGAADWTDDKLGDLDSFSVELQTFPQTSEEIEEQINGMIQVYQRIGLNGSYLHNDKTHTHMYETTAYWSIRKYCDQAQNQTISTRAARTGYATFGNGLP